MCLSVPWVPWMVLLSSVRAWSLPAHVAPCSILQPGNFPVRCLPAGAVGDHSEAFILEIRCKREGLCTFQHTGDAVNSTQIVNLHRIIVAAYGSQKR